MVLYLPVYVRYRKQALITQAGGCRALLARRIIHAVLMVPRSVAKVGASRSTGGDSPCGHVPLARGQFS